MSNQAQNAMGQLGNMDQVRELMFGPQIRKFEEELIKLNDSMNQISKELNQKIVALEKKISAEHESSVQLLEQKIKTVSNALQDESIELKEQLVRNERKANSTLDDVQQVFESQLEAMKHENSKNKEELHSELQELENSIVKLIHEQEDAIDNAKVSKDNLSSMLFDLAIKVKDTTIAANFDTIMQAEPSKEATPPKEQKK